MVTIIRTMLTGIFRDVHTLVWTMLLPVAMLLGLGLYLDDPAYSQRLLAGVLATNVLFGAAMVTAFGVMSHRNRGIYKLLRIAPFRTSAFIASVTAARTALTLGVSAAVVVMGVLVLGVRVSLGGMLLQLAALLLGSVCFTAVGFIAANLSRDEGNVNMISNLISFPMLFTSEAFYSLQHAPDWVRMVGRALPFHYFVEVLGIAVQRQPAYGDAWLPFAALAGFTAACLALAALTFRWDPQEGAAGFGGKRAGARGSMAWGKFNAR